jgi:hypothetical protein
LPVERLLLARLPLPLRNDRLVEIIKPSIELAIGRNKGNKDKAVGDVRTRRVETRRVEIGRVEMGDAPTHNTKLNP